jgi:iron(III) transport system permease protein
MTRGGPRIGSAGTALGAVAVAALSLTPVIYLFASGISLSDIRSEFRYPSTVSALVQTVGLTASVSVLTIAIGVGCALLVARTTVVLPRLLTVLFALPLAVPGFVSSYAAYSAQLLYAPRLDLVTSFPGASLVLALTLYPYVFLPCVVALRTIDPALEEVAASLRPQRLTRLRHVVLPALRPAIAAGVLIVALHVIAEYGAMVQLGQTTLTTKVMAEMLNYGDYQTARSLSLLLAGVSMVVLAITWIVATTGTAKQVAHGSNRPAPFTSLGRWRLPIAVASLAVPIAALGPTVFMTTRGLTDPNRSVVVDWSTVGSALWSTTGYAVAAALIATLLAFPVSWWVTRRPTRRSLITERLVWLAHAIPSAILALALVYLATHLVPSFYKTPSVLVIAYVILFLPLAVAYQRVGLGTSRQVYDDVAASLGIGPLRRFARISLPLALPGFAAGAILVALDASKELTTTLMLLPFNAHTLSSRLWATTNGESLDFTAAAPYALMLVLLGVVPVFFLVRHALRHVAPRPR